MSSIADQPHDIVAVVRRQVQHDRDSSGPLAFVTVEVAVRTMVIVRLGEDSWGRRYTTPGAQDQSMQAIASANVSSSPMRARKGSVIGIGSAVESVGKRVSGRRGSVVAPLGQLLQQSGHEVERPRRSLPSVNADSITMRDVIHAAQHVSNEG